jgi:hypothetical protein
MVILETPASVEHLGRRVAALGSCRVRNPFYALRDLGEIRVCKAGMSATHTAAEALQCLEVVSGLRTIPPQLNQYIYQSNDSPPTDALASTLAGGIDRWLVEISDRKQFWYGDIPLQQNFFVRKFIQPNRGVLLEWYRRLSRGEVLDSAFMAKTLANMRAGQETDIEDLEDQLRMIRFERASRAAITDTLARMMAMTHGEWTVEGAITFAGVDGAVMAERRALNADLAAACRDCGATFFDPSDLIARHGRETIMDGGGVDVYEYAPSAYPLVARSAISAAIGQPFEAPPGLAAAANLSERINKALVDLHGRRLADLGPSASGLYAHYQRLIEANSLIGARERAAFALIERHLPAFEHYGVMRAGLGELALLLAANGHAVTAHEPNINRRRAIEAGRDHFLGLGLIKQGQVVIRPTLTPEEPSVVGSLGVGLDVSEVSDDSAAAPHLLAASRSFGSLLIDPRLFIRLREGVGERGRLFNDLVGLGYTWRREYPDDELTWFCKPPAPCA